MANRLNRYLKRKPATQAEILYFSTLDTISVRRFDAALSGDLLALVKEPQGLTEAPDGAAKVWETLYREYAERAMDKDELRGYLLEGQIKALTLRYKYAKALLNRLRSGLNDEMERRFLEELAKWGYIADLKKPLGGELVKLFKQLKNSMTKINRLTEELEDLIGAENEKREAVSLNRLKVKAQIALKIDINLDVMTVDEWLIVWDEIDRLAKDAERRNLKAANDEQ